MFDVSSKLLARLRTTENGCWVFTGALDTCGIGIVWYEGRNRNAHVVSYEYHVGPIPQGLMVLHYCTSPACCNPKHLFLGTKKDNYDKMVRMGRAVPPIGTRKLSDLDIENVYAFIDCGYSRAEVARMYGVSRTAIGRIASGDTWPQMYRRYRA